MLRLLAEDEELSTKLLNVIAWLAVVMLSEDALTTTGSEKVNAPVPVPVKFAPRLILAPFVSNVIGEVNVWSLDKVIAPAVSDPKVMPVKPDCRYPSSVAVRSSTVSELLLVESPSRIVLPLVEGLITSVDCP